MRRLRHIVLVLPLLLLPLASGWTSPRALEARLAAQEAGPDPATIEIDLEPIEGRLQRAVAVVNAGDGSGRLFVIEKAGRVRIFRDDTLEAEPFLDIEERVNDRSNEQGLLGIAFHPDYAENGFFYVNYTAGGGAGRTVVSRFSVSEQDPDRADPGSEVEVITFDQPFPNHNGGHVVFGPDGYLYIGTGDGGAAGDPRDNAQDESSLLGKMLRLDVNVPGEGYTVPPDNPFVDAARARDEIWAVGLRNPWRYDFDPATGELYIGDVGQGQWEEINVQAADSTGGENYGWRIMEGSRCYNPSSGCNQRDLVLPVAEYPHSRGDKSVTGGLVYRGERWPGLVGLYLYADYASGRFWGLSRDAEGEWRDDEIGDFGLLPSSFGYGEDGEIYVSADGSGSASLYRLVQAGVEPVEPSATPDDPAPTATPPPTDVPPTDMPPASATPPPTASSPPPTATATAVEPTTTPWEGRLFLPLLAAGSGE